MQSKGSRALDVAVGLAIASVGLAVVVIAAQYPMGTFRRVGPGVLPVLLGGILFALGVAIMLVRSVEVIELPPLRLRPIAAVLGSLLSFGLLVRPLGLAPAIAIAVTIAAYGQKSPPLVKTLLLVVGLAVSVPLLFVWGLGVPMQIVRW